MTKFQWKFRYNILSVLFVTWAVAVLDRMAMPIALPYIATEFKLSPFETSLVLSTFFVGYALAHIPGGYLADRVGPRKVAAIALFWWSTFTAFTGLAAGLVQLLTVRFLFGLGEGTFPAASLKTIATWFSRKERATATAVMWTANSVGAAISPLVIVAIMAHWGWRSVFYVLLIPGLAVSALCWTFLKDDPEKVSTITAEELAEIKGDEAPPANLEKAKFREVLTPDIIKFFLVIFIFDITYWGFQSWLPTYLVQVRHFSMLEMGAASSLPFIAGSVGRLIGGWISDRYFRERRALLVVITQALSGLFLFIMFVAPMTWALVLAQTLAGMFLNMFQAAFWALPMSTIPKEKMGMAAGFINMGGQIGGLVSPLCIGAILQFSHGNFGSVGIFLECSILVAALTILSVKQSPTAA